jgi:hypothetical protein
VSHGVVRPQPNCFLQLGSRIVDRALVCQGASEIAVGSGIAWVETDGVLVQRDGIIQPALSGSEVSQVETGDKKVRAKAYCLLICTSCRIKVPLSKVGISEVVMRLWITRPQAKGLWRASDGRDPEAA